MQKIHIDIESRSTIDIKKTGARRYAEDPSTEILFFAYAPPEGDPSVWLPGMPIPDFFFKPEICLAAWNAEFEICMFEHDSRFPKIPDFRWTCTMSDALALGLPGGLDSCGAALAPAGLSFLKSKEGTRLIGKYSKPKKDRNFNDFYADLANGVEDAKKFIEYCRQDVRTERAISEFLPYATVEAGLEREYYLATVGINRRGIPVDTKEVLRIQSIMDRHAKSLVAELPGLTAGLVTTAGQTEKIREFCRINGIILPDLQAPTVAAALEGKLPAGVRRVLEIRSSVGGAAVKKYTRMRTSVCSDGTIKNNLVYHKAQTGRYAGSGVQFQNLARQRKQVAKRSEYAMDIINSTPHLVPITFGDVMALSKDLIRAVIKAPRGKKFLCADFSGVEARATAWACYEHDRVSVFESGRDIYIETAAGIYGKRYEDISKDGDERQSGKIVELSGGYQGGWSATLRMAQQYRIALDEVLVRQLVNMPAAEVCSFLLDSLRTQLWQDVKIRDKEEKSRQCYERSEAAERKLLGLRSSYDHIDSHRIKAAAADIGVDLARAKAYNDNQSYRASRPLLVQAWGAFGAAAFEAMRSPDSWVEVQGVRPAAFRKDGNFLLLRLPSDRCIAYPFPDIRDTEATWGETICAVTAMTVDTGGKWVRRGMYGGKFFQNYIQALCRDLLFFGMLRTQKYGYPWVLSVHDEGLALVPDSPEYNLRDFIALLTGKPDWAEGFPLGADGWEGYRYRK